MISGCYHRIQHRNFYESRHLSKGRLGAEDLVRTHYVERCPGASGPPQGRSIRHKVTGEAGAGGARPRSGASPRASFNCTTNSPVSTGSGRGGRQGLALAAEETRFSPCYGHSSTSSGVACGCPIRKPAPRWFASEPQQSICSLACPDSPIPSFFRLLGAPIRGRTERTASAPAISSGLRGSGSVSGAGQGWKTVRLHDL